MPPVGEEYVSFHYQNHKIPDAVPVNYVSSAPKTFDELYSPRLMGVRIIGKETKEKIEYTMYEDRKNKLMVIIVKDTEGAKEAMRSIFLDLKLLYEELHFKTVGNRDVLMKKEDKAFNDDAELDAVCKVFIVDRLKFEDELEWPLLRDISDPAPPPSSSSSVAISDEDPHKERMAIFMKLSGDEAFSNSLEVKCPRNYKGLGISMSSFRPKPLSKEAINKKKEAAAAAAAKAAAIEAPATTNAADEPDTVGTGAVAAGDNNDKNNLNNHPSDDLNNDSAPVSDTSGDTKEVAKSTTPTSAKTQKAATATTPNASPNKKVAAGSGASAVKAAKAKK